MAEFKHVTVLLNEAVENLKIKPDGVYVDCTLGGGGHTRKILSQLNENGRLFSFDQDRTAIEYNQKSLDNQLQSGKLTLVKDNFRNIKKLLNDFGVSKLMGRFMILEFHHLSLMLLNAGLVINLKLRWICGWIKAKP